MDENGHRFYLDRIPKRPGYIKLENGHLRTPWGIDVVPVSEDESYYYLRIYDHSDFQPLKEAPTTWTAEEQAAIAATYPPPLDRLPVSHRLAFEPFDRGLPRSGQWRNGFRFADMNGDGALDLVHGPARKRPGTPVIFLGDRRGTWRAWTEATFPPLPYDYGDVAVADFDGDGTPDLALAVHLRGVLVLVQDGKGRFTLRSEGIPFQRGASDPPAFSSRAIVATDWDRDGRVDVLAAGDGPRMGSAPGDADPYGVAWYRNLGNGAWERKNAPQREVFGESLALGDLDGDGDDDLVVGSSLLGSSRLLVLSQGESRWVSTDVPALRGGYNPAVAIGDFDGDRKLDLAVGHQTYEGGSWRFGLDLHLQRAAGGWERRGVWTESGQDRLLSIASGDLDGDGRVDLVAASANGRVVVLRNDGATFALEAVALTESRETCGGYHVEIADLDGDGLRDVAIDFSGESEGSLEQLATGPPARGCPNDGAVRAWRTLMAPDRRAGGSTAP